MEITRSDTVDTVRLKLRMRDLEMENCALRMREGFQPNAPVSCGIESLPVRDVAEVATLRLAATWQAKLDRYSGKLHVLGRTEGPQKLVYSYWIDLPELMSPTHHAHVLERMHALLVRELAEKMKDEPL